jgi:hypothetical protein
VTYYQPPCSSCETEMSSVKIPASKMAAINRVTNLLPLSLSVKAQEYIIRKIKRRRCPNPRVASLYSIHFGLIQVDLDGRFRLILV